MKGRTVITDPEQDTTTEGLLLNVQEQPAGLLRGVTNNPEGVPDPHTPATDPQGVSTADILDPAADPGVSTATDTPDPAAGPEGVGSADTPEPATFPRAYVEQLRKESAGYRDRARQADDLATRLHAALVGATGRLADPTDLPFDQAHLDDPEAMGTAMDDLLARKPHLASRRVRGDVGQGASGGSATSVDLAGLLRSRAG